MIAAQPPPVLLYLHDLSATGVTRNALALAAALAADRPVHLVCGRASGTLAAEAAALSPHCLGGHGAAAVARLRRLARALPPHVALSAGNRGHLLFAAALAGVGQRRCIYRFSNDIDHRDASGRQAWWKPASDRAQLALLRCCADHVVTVSHALAADPRLAGVACTAIPNGVDTGAIIAAAALPCDHPWALPGAPPFAMAIGRLAAQKDFATLISALAIARRTRPLRLLIAGDGPQRAMLQQCIAAHGLADCVQLAGALANPQPLLARAAVFALPSLWEGASNALLEALALRIPIVASSSAGNAATVLDGGRHGVLVPPGDAVALAAALLAQAGHSPVRPGNRAQAFDRQTGLRQWRALVAAQAQRLPPGPFLL
jgi:glycosyltransferase involved in cell wall biosynthesis